MQKGKGVRPRSIKRVFSKKFRTFPFNEGMYFDCFGNPCTSGFWIIYGHEKHGKTSFALQLGEYLCQFAKVWYVSAEEGIGFYFQKTMQLLNIDDSLKKYQFLEYIAMDELRKKLNHSSGAKILIIDNVTFYQDELKNGIIRKLKDEFPSHLFIFLAHEDEGKKEPYTATAKLIKKLADAIIRVEGLACFVSGRVKGGTLLIHEDSAKLYHSNSIGKS